MNKLLELYKNILESFNLTVNNDGYVYSGKTTVLKDGKPLVLPTEENIKTLMVPNESGKFVAVKSLFNPLNENLLRGENRDMIKLKNIANLNISLLVSVIGELLLLGAYEEMSRNTPPIISEFLVFVKDARKPNMKKLVDEPMIEKWRELMNKHLTSNTKPVKLYTKRAVIKDAERFNRGITIDFPLYNIIGTEECEMKLRNKDISIFKGIFEFLFKNELKDNVIGVSNDKTAPAILSLLKAYLKIINKLNGFKSDLVKVDPEVADIIDIKVKYTVDDILNIENYKKYLSSIPEIREDGYVEQYENVVPAKKQDIVNRSRETRHIIPDEQVNNQATEMSVEDNEDETAMLLKSLHGQAPVTPNPYMNMGQQMQQPISPVLNKLKRERGMEQMNNGYMPQQNPTMQQQYMQQPYCPQPYGMVQMNNMPYNTPPVSPYPNNGNMGYNGYNEPTVILPD